MAFPVLLASVLFVLAMAAAAWNDVRTRRVPNLLNLTLLVAGVTFALWERGGVAGLRYSLAGAGLAFAIWFPMFVFRLMGAGDVKLLTAAGAWLGVGGIALASLVTGVLGAALGVLWLLKVRGLWLSVHALSAAIRSPGRLRLQSYDARDRMPYAVAIAGGVLYAWFGHHGRVLLGQL
jgi:prepilin peptidase CpaA